MITVFVMKDLSKLYQKLLHWLIYETKYSRMDQVKFVEDSLFLKAVFHKFHLVHS